MALKGVISGVQLTMTLIRAVFCIGFGAIILLTPAAFNRSPFLFYDTASYLEFGRAIASRLPLFRNLATGEAPATKSSQESVPTGSTGDDREREHPSLSYAGGRSPYYSFFIYVLVKFGSLWSVACLQALLAATLLWISYTVIATSASAITFLIATTILAGMSTLSFYVAMLMPDVFAGLALLALGLLTLGFDRMSNWLRIGLVVTIAGAASTHLTIPVVCGAALACVVLTQLLLNGRAAIGRWYILVWATAGLALTSFLYVLFFESSKVVLGATPQSPPYLMARVLADGTGRAYLHDACDPLPTYTLCAFQRRKFRDDYEFLWDGDPAIGVFSASDYETRKKLKAEELSFVLGTVTHYPLWQARVSATHWMHQLIAFGLSEFQSAKRTWDVMAFNILIPEQEALYKSSRAYQGNFPFGLFIWLQAIGLIVSLAWLPFRLSGADVRAALRRRHVDQPNAEGLLITSGIALLGALLANAAICGIFSGVYDRYQARLIWLVPALAILVFCRLGLRSTLKIDHSA
jgi:hypothetical protein